MKEKTFVAVLTFCAAISGLSAETAIGRFTGRVTSTGANSVTISEVQVGDQVTGTFGFNTDAADAVAQDPNTGRYLATSLALSVRDYQFSASDNTIEVSNDRPLISGQPAFDAYEVVSPYQDVTGPALSELSPVQIDLVMLDSVAATFTDDSLPLSLNIGDFDIVSEDPYGTTGGRLIFQSQTDGAFGEVRFEITSLTIEVGEVTAADVIVYPQLAVGGGYEVILLVNNTSDSAWTGGAEPLLSDGSLDYLRTSIDLGPRETRKYKFTGGPDAVTTGLVIVPDSGSDVSALAVSYFFNFSSGGELLDSTGVPAGTSARKFIFPVEKSAAVNTGLAMRRLPSQGDAPITLTLYGADGSKVQEISRGSGLSRFFDELFTGVPQNFTGSVVAESSGDFYLVVLRLETTTAGFQLTSVPPLPN